MVNRVVSSIFACYRTVEQIPFVLEEDILPKTDLVTPSDLENLKRLVRQDFHDRNIDLDEYCTLMRVLTYWYDTSVIERYIALNWLDFSHGGVILG